MRKGIVVDSVTFWQKTQWEEGFRFAWGVDERPIEQRDDSIGYLIGYLNNEPIYIKNEQIHKKRNSDLHKRIHERFSKTFA